EDREELHRLYHQMLLIRRFEERVAEMYTRARVGGYTHLNIGEEATVVGSAAALEPTDYLINSYREHGHVLARGTDAGRVMAELFGKETGVVRGRGGSMHLFDLERRFLGGYAIVGSHLPLAVGVALAIDYRNGREVVMCAFGEGATNIGAFHESMNLAKLWRLPIVFLCTNNQYAMGAAVHQDSAVVEIYRKACAYDMRAQRVDGMDVLGVREACREAVRIARDERQPSFIEALSYRFRGHSMADPARYRTQEEVQAWVARDPVVTFRRRLEEAELLAGRVEREVNAAIDFAERSPDPDPVDLFADVYAGGGD
ncbi:MAG: pyruvate dehydrogenase (acetyl-transferring) E1 component subunit alpha, partial [Chloroflexi bacterium]|nr:pyruvate dehydrogenase (acetyl-transferring) E1 component subunit alpha [Chloroflexota bacterium]